MSAKSMKNFKGRNSVTCITKKFCKCFFFMDVWSMYSTYVTGFWKIIHMGTNDTVNIYSF